MVTRREFLKLSAMAGASLVLPVRWLSRPLRVQAAASSNALKKFIQPLRRCGGTGIPVMQPDTVNPGWWQPGVTHYTIDIGQFEDQLHPDLPNPDPPVGVRPGREFQASGRDHRRQAGQTRPDHLPQQPAPGPHILPVDDTIMGVMGNQMRPDGCPPIARRFRPLDQRWHTALLVGPGGHHGDSFVNVLNPNLAPNEAEYYYPNDQSARLVWYHDHASASPASTPTPGLPRAMSSSTITSWPWLPATGSTRPARPADEST